MKRFIVEQRGYVQVEAGRAFVVEAPDTVSEEEVYDLLKTAEPVAEDEDMAWCDELERRWIGFDVDVMEIDVCEAEADEEPYLKVVRLDELEKEARVQ